MSACPYGAHFVGGCIELLTTRQLQLPIHGEPADWLRAVRRGDVPFGEWQARWRALDSALEKLDTDETYPAGPDRSRIERWSVEAHLMSWRSGLARP